MSQALSTICPNCSAKHDLVSQAIGEDGPHAGALTLCFSCGEWAIFTDTLSLRKPTEDEYIDIGLDPGARRVREVWVKVTGGKKP